MSRIDELFALLRRRGVLWPSAEIYGGIQGLYDYGPVGTAIKRRIETAWTEWMVGANDDFYLIEPSELLPEPVVRASGHLENFTDPEVECDSCHSPFRADTLLEATRPEGVDGLSPAEIGELVQRSAIHCPRCGGSTWSVPRPFQLMFSVDFGATGHERAYLRPETAQNSYLAFARMWDVGRHALPLGIAVIGRAYRNEIAPRQVLFRTRAFTQAELQIFFDPLDFLVPFEEVADEGLPMLPADRRIAGDVTPIVRTPQELVASGELPEWYAYHLARSYRFYRDVLGYPAEKIRLYEKSDRERAFYNRIQYDVEVELPSLGGFREVGALHYRGDYDLTRHGQGSGQDLSVARPDGSRVIPHVLEITFGVDRNLWALADLHLKQDGDRTVWQLPTYLAPLAGGVFPLLRKEHGAAARTVWQELRRAGIPVEYHATGSVGKRYARMDEIGAPWCITIDHETLSEGPLQGTVTLRARDSRAQERLTVAALIERLHESLLPPIHG
jgi:glycyl-tRNA synthetase